MIPTWATKKAAADEYTMAFTMAFPSLLETLLLLIDFHEYIIPAVPYKASFRGVYVNTLSRSDLAQNLFTHHRLLSPSLAVSQTHVRRHLRRYYRPHLTGVHRIRNRPVAYLSS